jgi:hypothetical protein
MASRILEIAFEMVMDLDTWCCTIVHSLQQLMCVYLPYHRWIFKVLFQVYQIWVRTPENHQARKIIPAGVDAIVICNVTMVHGETVTVPAGLEQALREAEQQRDSASERTAAAEASAAEASRTCDSLRMRIDAAAARADADAAEIAELKRVNQGMRNVLEAATGSSGGVGGKAFGGKSDERLQPGPYSNEWYASFLIRETQSSMTMGAEVCHCCLLETGLLSFFIKLIVRRCHARRAQPYRNEC